MKRVFIEFPLYVKCVKQHLGFYLVDKVEDGINENVER